MRRVLLLTPISVIQQLHAYLIGLAFNLSTFIVNLNRENVARGFSIGMFVNIVVCTGIIIIIPAVSKSHTEPSFIFGSVENISGWESKGVAFLVGLINANYSFGLIDTAVHMSEKITEPEKNVPKALFLTVGIGFITAWPLAVLLMYYMADFDAIVIPRLVSRCSSFSIFLCERARPGRLS